MVYKKLLSLVLLAAVGNTSLVWAQQKANLFDQKAGPKKGTQQAAALLNADRIDGSAHTTRSIAGTALKKIENVPAQATVVQKITDGSNPVPVFMQAHVEQKSKMKTFSVFEAGAAAGEYLQAVKSDLQVQDATAEFAVSGIETDASGRFHIRVRQQYKQIPVYGSELVLHGKGAEITHLNGRTFPTPQIGSTNAALSNSDAIGKAKTYLQGKTHVRELTAAQKTLSKYTGPQATLMIYHVNKDASKARLAWHVEMKPNFMERWVCLVDAENGSVLHAWSMSCEIDGPATTSANDLNNVSRTVNSYSKNGTYYMIDATKPMFNLAKSSIPDDPAGANWVIDAQNTNATTIVQISNASNSGWPAKGVSAQYNAGYAFDYYKNTHARNSVNGQGGTIISVINVSDENGVAMDNAYWSGEMMCYGNGKVAFKPLAASLDVAGHEMTHGVVQNTANLEYNGQSGAINESMADIFGCMMDRNDWLIGEDVVKLAYFPTGALRSLQDPHNGGNNLNDNGYQPRIMAEYYTGTDDNNGVHTNSGIPNWAFYKFATAVGKADAEKVYYNALKNYLTKTSQFVDLRISVVQTCIDLFGASSTQVAAAKTAFNEVQIYGDDPGGGGSGGTGTNTAVDLPVNPGQDFILSYDVLTADPNTLYMSSTTGTNYVGLSTTDMLRKPSVTDNGAACVFVASDNRIYSMNLTGTPAETQVSNQPVFDNVAISKEINKHLAAVTNSVDTSIYVYDYGLQQWKQFKLYNPTYSQGVNAGGVLYADALEWDYTGQYVLYDAKNVISNPFGADIEYWDIGMIKVWDNATNTWGNGSIQKLYTQLPAGVSIGNPTFSKNSPYIIAFDYIDANAGNAVMAKNIVTGDDGVIFNGNSKLGFPSYSKLDNKIIFDAYNASNAEVIAQIPINTDKISSSSSATQLIPDAKWGIWIAQGSRALRSNAKSLLSYSFPALNPPVNGTISNSPATVSLTVPANTNLTNLIASFSISAFADATVSGTPQVSGVTPNDFTSTVYYTLKAQDGSSQTYAVTVTKSSSGTGILPAVSKQLSVYPNPARSSLQVNMQSPFSYAVYDMLGHLIVKGENDDNSSIDITSLAQGMYLLKVNSNNEQFSTRFSKN